MLNAIQNASIASKVVAMSAPTPINEATQLASPPFTPPPGPTTNNKVFSDSQLSIKTLFYLATLGGANVCSLTDRIGSFSPGKSFDALLVSVLDKTGALGVWGKEAKSDGDMDAQREKLEENLERFLFCGDDRNILKVYVQGCLVGGRLFHKQDQH